MNELDIHKAVDKLLEQAESELEIIFSRALRDILRELESLYRKHGEFDHEPTYTSLNRYNRVHSMLQRISEEMTKEYQAVVLAIQQMSANTYMETYLKQAYLFEVFTSIDMGFMIPPTEVLLAAIVNPIEQLTLPVVLEVHRNEIVRKLNLTIEQGLRHGLGYFEIAANIERDLNFSKNKARTVARTEAGRVQSVANEMALEEAAQYAMFEKIWLSALDHKVRNAHRVLDGQSADKDGYFHSKGYKAKHPHGFGVAELDINCRCKTITKINGMLPSVRRARNYADKTYQKRLSDEINRLMNEEELTFAQAFYRADKRIQPPNVEVPFMTFNKWYESKLAG